VIASDGVVHRFRNNRNRFTAVPFRIAAERLDVTPDGFPWIVGEDGYVYQNNSSGWTSRKGDFKARDLSIRDNKFVLWALNDSGVSHHYEGGGRWKSYGGVANHITAARDGSYWVITISSERIVLAYHGLMVRMNIFQPNL